jgi:hypothetical protein
MTTGGGRLCRPRLVTLRQAGAEAALGRSRLLQLLDQGEIASVHLLDRRLIVVASLQAFIARQRERAVKDGRVRMPPDLPSN